MTGDLRNFKANSCPKRYKGPRTKADVFYLKASETSRHLADLLCRLARTGEASPRFR